ncbi:hypothetical protein V6N13_068498 [Hibiscus sabdariffa]
MHGLPEWTQVSIFYNSVNIPTRMMLDASANGTLLDKPPRESLEILDKLAQNDYQHPTSRRGTTRRGPAQLDSSDTILAQIASLINMVKNMQKQPHIQELLMPSVINVETTMMLRSVGSKSNQAAMLGILIKMSCQIHTTQHGGIIQISHGKT